MSRAGDINHDGFADIVIGGVQHYDPSTANGASGFVVFGKASFAPVVALGQLDGTDGFQMRSSRFFGYATLVSEAGDINADGFADLIVSATDASDSYVIFGKAGDFVPVVTLDLLDGHDGFQIVHASHTLPSGGSARTAGDVNGDGFDDLIVPNSSEDFHTAYLIYGSADPVPGADQHVAVALPDLTDDKLVHSRIASVVIQGRAIGTAAVGDHFGIVAGEIFSLQVGTTIIPLRPGSYNDDHGRPANGTYDGFKLGSTQDPDRPRIRPLLSHRHAERARLISTRSRISFTPQPCCLRARPSTDY